MHRFLAENETSTELVNDVFGIMGLKYDDSEWTVEWKFMKHEDILKLG